MNTRFGMDVGGHRSTFLAEQNRVEKVEDNFLKKHTLVGVIVLSFITGGFYDMDMVVHRNGWRGCDTDWFTGSLFPHYLHSQNEQSHAAVREN